MGLFRITGVEATQSIQTFSSPPLEGTNTGSPDNSVPLVANRRTILRVYVADARPDSRLFAYLPYGSPPPFAGIQPALYSRWLSPPPQPPVRARADHTLQIVLPPQAPGTQTFTLHVVETDPSFALSPREALPTSITLNFLERRLVRIRLVRVRYRGRGLDLPPRSVQEFWNALDTAHRVLPVAQPGFQIVRESVHDYDGDFTQISPEAHNPDWSGYAGNRGTTGNLLNILDGLAASEALPADVIYVAIYPNGANQSPWAGWAVGRWIISDLDGMTLTHELAHKLCVPMHAPCGSPAYVDANFPKFAGLPAASIGDVGFDPTGMTALDPATTFDLMSYCRPGWLSAYNYRKVLHCLTPPTPPRKPPPPPFKLPRSVPLVLVRFPPDRWIKVELPHLPLPPLPGPPPEKGPIDVAVFDRDGRQLAGLSGPMSPGSTDGEWDNARIELDIPWPDEAERVEVRIGKDLIWSHRDSGPAPGLSVRWPSARSLRGGKGRVVWEVSGPADYLVVRASNDGGETWSAKVLSGDAQEFSLDREMLLAGTDCRLEVVALRGFRSSHVTSPSFRIEPAESSLLVLSPRDGERVEAGTYVRFEAISSAPHAGIEWHSDVDGLLGRHAFLLLSSLSPGEHLIEARSAVPFERPVARRLVVTGTRNRSRFKARSTNQP